MAAAPAAAEKGKSSYRIITTAANLSSIACFSPVAQPISGGGGNCSHQWQNTHSELTLSFSSLSFGPADEADLVSCSGAVNKMGKEDASLVHQPQLLF